jgi:hypothetical protein
VLGRTGVPCFVNVVYDSPAEAKAAALGDIELMHCGACGLIFNRAYGAGGLGFTPDYENEQSLSPRFAAHMAEGVERVLSLIPAEGPVTVVEIGCGQAAFLRLLAERLDRPATLLGYDPVVARRTGSRDPVEERVGAADIRLYPEYFPLDSRFAGQDLVVFVMRAVFGYIQEPVAFLRALKSAAGAAPAVVCIETPTIETILRERSIFDVYYEYFAYYSDFSISEALKLAGWGDPVVHPQLEGQYMWVEANSIGAPANLGRSFAREEAEALGAADAAMRERWQGRIRAARAKGPVAVWGAGGKGLNFVSLVDPDAELIDCLVDINPFKQGRYSPQTGHPIVAPEQAAKRGVRSACLLNPAYEAEVRQRIQASGGGIDLILDGSGRAVQ